MNSRITSPHTDGDVAVPVPLGGGVFGWGSIAAISALAAIHASIFWQI